MNAWAGMTMEMTLKVMMRTRPTGSVCSALLLSSPSIAPSKGDLGG